MPAKARWPRPVSGAMVAFGSGECLAGLASRPRASVNESRALPDALPLSLAAANGANDSALTVSTRKFGLLSRVKLHWLNVELFIGSTALRGPGRNLLSVAGDSTLHASGTDLNSPFCSEVTYGSGAGELRPTSAITAAATTHAPIATPLQRRMRRLDRRNRAAAARLPARRPVRGTAAGLAAGTSSGHSGRSSPAQGSA